MVTYQSVRWRRKKNCGFSVETDQRVLTVLLLLSVVAAAVVVVVVVVLRFLRGDRSESMLYFCGRWNYVFHPVPTAGHQV